MLASLRTKFLLPTFLRFFSESFQKNVKSHVFWNLKKNEKYVFSNTAAHPLNEAAISSWKTVEYIEYSRVERPYHRCRYWTRRVRGRDNSPSVTHCLRSLYTEWPALTRPLPPCCLDELCCHCLLSAVSRCQQTATLYKFNIHCRLFLIIPECKAFYLLKTRKLSYRKGDRAMRPIYGCPENFRSPWIRPRQLCSDRSHECAYKIWSSYPFLR